MYNYVACGLQLLSVEHFLVSVIAAQALYLQQQIRNV